MPSRTTIVIADSHEIFREGIARQLTIDAKSEIVGEAADGYSTIKICRQMRPDVLFMDLGMTRPSGLETVDRLRKADPSVKIVLMASDLPASEVEKLTSIGVVGIVPREASGAQFFQALKAAQNGFACLHERYLSDLVNMSPCDEPRTQKRPAERRAIGL